MFDYAEIVKLLLEHGARVNALSNRRLTPLNYAIIGEKEQYGSSSTIIDLLLKGGADIGAINADFLSPENNVNNHLLNTLLVQLALRNSREAYSISNIVEANKTRMEPDHSPLHIRHEIFFLTAILLGDYPQNVTINLRELQDGYEGILLFEAAILEEGDQIKNEKWPVLTKTSSTKLL
jgi:ankyrin repeat protein